MIPTIQDRLSEYFIPLHLREQQNDMKKAFIILMAAAVFAACNKELTVTPAISFFPNSPEVAADSAIFRVAAAFLPKGTEVNIPVRFGGDAVKGVDYRVSAENFVLGGETPSDVIIVWHLQKETGKELNLSLVLPEGFEFGKYSTASYTLP